MAWASFRGSFHWSFQGYGLELVVLNPDFHAALRAVADHPFAVRFLGDAGRIDRLRVDEVIEREPRFSQTRVALEIFRGRHSKVIGKLHDAPLAGGS